MTAQAIVKQLTKGTITKRFAYVKDRAGTYIELLEPLD